MSRAESSRTCFDSSSALQTNKWWQAKSPQKQSNWTLSSGKCVCWTHESEGQFQDLKFQMLESAKSCFPNASGNRELLPTKKVIERNLASKGHNTAKRRKISLWWHDCTFTCHKQAPCTIVAMRKAASTSGTSGCKVNGEIRKPGSRASEKHCGKKMPETTFGLGKMLVCLPSSPPWSHWLTVQAKLTPSAKASLAFSPLYAGANCTAFFTL